MRRDIFLRTVLICTCAILSFFAGAFYVGSPSSLTSKFTITTGSGQEKMAEDEMKKDTVDNSGAVSYLTKYEALFGPEINKSQISPNPNNSDTITTWWQAAAMIDWYIECTVRYECKNKTAMGNWLICQDEPYTVRSPCLVYSFGINWDFSFDDAMANLGCEVHSFDPSMKKDDHKRGNRSTFHNMGLGSTNTDGFVPRRNNYVRDSQVWKMRTVKAIMKELGHENSVIDVFKMDIEGSEWGVLDNMMETGVLKYIRQFNLEFHLFPHFPLREEYVYLYKTYTRLRELGFREYAVGPYRPSLKADSYNIQGESKYVNAFFKQV